MIEYLRQYRLLNKEKLRLKRRTPEKIAARAALDHEYRCKNLSAIKKRNDRRYSSLEGRLKRLCSSSYARSRKKHLANDLTYETILAIWQKQNGRCALTGLLMDLSNRLDNTLKPSIDRIDSTKGYILENVRLVCWWVNVAKWQLTDKQFIAWCKIVARAN